ncbi:glycosyltransferase family 4 protein [Pedobacter sp. MC2016-14]|uniref:glycosyltransferase family 4 protein n=1 Tax=Pedobacter sp. MC2016-14 TaxID=2897327 RepID=UPI001E3A7472|nr:glycosyltransferase family 4 protein [Pedobacter sp. MC2016-14]MCD0487542.1 glycosyltransferase family 4 protein [Pedobacter sp. MC2016-14]
MKVALINTSDAGGGAPVASMRLLKALESAGVDVKFVTQQKKTEEAAVTEVSNGLFSRLKAKFDFLYERLPFIFFYAKNKSVRFAFSTANAGTSIADNAAILDADILHLHWTNSGFLSIADLKELLKLGKPIVWTLHDMWTFTGGCHYAGTCDHFMNQCGHCYFLTHPGPDDLSNKGWLRKADMYTASKNIAFVTCSSWLADVARKSSLLKGFSIQSIPNPIDTEVYAPKDKLAMRQKWKVSINAKIILFGAANINDRRKGITYLVNALEHLKRDYVSSTPIEVMIFGKNKHFDVTQLPFPVHSLNMISSQQDLAELYSLADVYVLPSVEDNLPNTVMEALSCGTPVVAFNTGGLPEMIVHQKNGYLAKFESSADLAKGIYEILMSNHAPELSLQARNKVLNSFTAHKVSHQYLEVYQSLIL